MPDPIPTQADQQANPALQAHLDAVTKLRQAGYSWDQVSQYYGQQTDRLRAAGYKEDQIRAYYGGQDPAPVANAIDQRVQQNVAAGGHKNWLDAFTDGLTNSSTAALLGHAPTPDQPGEGTGAAISHSIGETLGDLPVAIPSAFVAGKGATFAAARVLPGEAKVLAPAVGGIVGAFNAAATPTLIKSERDAWVQAGHQGWNAADFLQQHGLSAQGAVAAAGQGAAGALTAGVGGAVGRKLAQAGVTGLGRFATQTAVEAGTYATVSRAVQGQMPSVQDFVDGSILIGAFHVGGKASAATYRAYRARLEQHYVETGQGPADAAQAAQHDPVLRRELMGMPNPPARPGSSRTDIGVPPTTASGAPDHMAPPVEQHVIPRVAGHFDEAVDFTLKHEGGAYVIDANGKGVKWGINAADNPGIDIPHLSRDDAAEIYKHKYWDAIGADTLAPDMRLAAFDTAVVEGVSRAKLWLAESGGDVKTFLGKRAAFEAELAQRNPAKYGRYVKAWGNRIRDLGGQGESAALVSRDPSEPMSKAEQGILANEGLPPEPPEKPPEEGGGGKPPEPPAEDAWAHVMGRVAPDEGRDWLASKVQQVRDVYGELFADGHPLRKLVDAVTNGREVADTDNPAFLDRLRENSGEQVKHNISVEQTDLRGQNVTGRSLEAILNDVGDKPAQKRFLDGYALARWADMMHSRDLKTGVDPEMARQVIADGEQIGKGKKNWASLFSELVGFRNNSLNWLAESGVHSPAKVADLIAENEASIPGYRRMDDGTYKPMTTAKRGIFNPIKTAKGSERPVEPILKSLLQDTFLRHQLAMDNLTAVKASDLAKLDDGASERRVVNVNVMQALDQLKAKGLDDEDAVSALVRAAGGTVKKDEVPYFRDGKPYAATFSDPEITRLLRNYDAQARPTILKWLSSVTSVPRNLQTRFNPAFPLHILTYDSFWQHIVNPDARNTFANFFAGVGGLLDKTPEGQARYNNWLASGGADHVFSSLSKDQYVQNVLRGHLPGDESLGAGAWNLMKSGAHALTGWTSMVGAIYRYGRYQEGLKAGESPTRAAVASTEAAFHRAGYGGPAAKAINSVFPYTTAHLNGLDKIVRAQFGLGKTITGKPYDWKATTIKGALTLTLPSMLLWMHYKDAEWYKAQPDWKKDNGIFLPLPGHPYIGTGPLLSLLYVGIPRRLAEAFIQDNPHAAEGLSQSIVASVAPANLLTGISIFQPIAEHITNWSFFKQQPLVSPDTLRGVGAAEQYNHYSTGFARSVARFASDIPLLSDMKLSPPVIDNYISQWGGPNVIAALHLLDAVVPTSNPKPAERFSDSPFISSWMTRYPAANSQPITDFWNRSDQLQEEHGSLTAAMHDGDLARFKQLAERDPSAAAYHAMKFGGEPSTVDTSPYIGALSAASDKADWQDINLIRQGEKAMQQSNAYANGVWRNPAMNAQDKRQILDAVAAQQQVMAERITEAMDRAHIGGSRPSSHAAPAPESIQFQPPAGAQ